MDNTLAFVITALVAAFTAVTAVTRVAGTEIMNFVTIIRRVEVFLESMATSVMLAIVATVVVAGGIREASAALVAGAVM